ncbi:MAG: bifunctional aspartate kinase/homoserine dehydrogenase I [Flavobacteriaceae bacterium]
MKVLKFGGTSVAHADHIKKVKQIIAEKSVDRVFIVVSALGGITDLLIKASDLAAQREDEYKTLALEIEKRHLDTIKALIPLTGQSGILSDVKTELNTLDTLLEGAFLIGEITPRLLDKIVSYGELLSSHIITEYLKSENLDASLKDSRELIITDDNYGKAVINFDLTNRLCQEYFEESKEAITILPGFVSSSENGNATTLGRGGSDYTAAVVAAALKAEVLEIWTDVSGMYTANPKLVKQAKAISHISYEEAMELSHFGAKVLYPPTIQPVLIQGIPVLIKNTFNPGDPGTSIEKNNEVSKHTVQGISHVPKISLLTLEGPGMIGIPGISRKFFEVLSLAQISVVLITQASSEHSICIGLADEDAPLAKKLINEAFAYEIERAKIKPVMTEEDLAIIALVGDQMKSHQGLSGKMFSTLGKNNVNIRAIAQGASERNISAVIRKEDVKKALNALHETFFEENIKQLNLFVMGVGNVGSKLLRQIDQQRSYLKKQHRLNIRVIGISNSRKMLFDEDGISIGEWEKALAGGTKADAEEFFDTVLRLNFRNSIFIDNTASADVAATYIDYLRHSIAVVTCNKIACSSELDQYQKLKEVSREYNAPFLFETNVGAGLPIIDTLKHLIASGDKIHKIQAVLSGSLNFVFNNFNGKTTFSEVVKRAQLEGYTEPDPKIDLSGVDVMRKILILARESGYAIDMEQIENQSFLPIESLQTKTNDEFYQSLEKNEQKFQDIFDKAMESNCKLKYVAKFEKGHASVGLQHIPKDHDFYKLEGSDNIVLFFTERYPDQPLVVKGAGAGADVTASGIFADIIRIGNF